MSLHLFATPLVAWLFVAACLPIAAGHAADMQYPLAVAASDAGEIYVADRNLPGVWKIKAGQRTLFFEGSRKFRTPLNAIRCLAIDRQGRLLAGDSSTRRVYRFDEAGKPVSLIADEIGIGIPMAIAANSAGLLLVADLELGRIFKLPSEGGKAEPFVTIPAPRGLAVDRQDNLWVVAGIQNGDQVLKVAPDGKIETVVKGHPFSFPSQIVLDAEGTAYVCDSYSKAIWKVGGGEPTKWVAGEPFVHPVGLAWQAAGERLLVADPRANAIFGVDKEGKVARVSP